MSTAIELMNKTSFSGKETEKVLANKEVICPSCGKKLSYIRRDGVKGRFWAHESGLCDLVFKNENEIKAYVKPEDRSYDEPANTDTTIESTSVRPEDKTSKNKNRYKDFKVNENSDKPKEKPVKVTMSLTRAEYEGIGGDSATYDELIKGANKILNNVDIHAFDFVDPDEEPKGKDEKEEILKKEPEIELGQKPNDKHIVKTLRKVKKEDEMEIKARVSHGNVEIIREKEPAIDVEKIKPSLNSESYAVVPYLVSLDGTSSQVIFNSGVCKVGKSKTNDFVIEGDNLGAVSRNHAEIYNIGNRFYIKDISSNGIHIENENIKFKVIKDRLTELNNNDSVYFAQVKYTFMIQEEKNGKNY